MAKILITGGNRGIGYFMVQQLLSDAHKLCVLDLEVDRLPAHTALLALECDLSDTDAVNRGVLQAEKTFGTFDAAVHNAALCTFPAFEDATEEEFRRVHDVNLLGAVRLTKALLPAMLREGRGRILFTSSGVGVMGFGNISPYATSKGAIESLARCLDLEYRSLGITFHLLHPPLTRTRSAGPLPVPDEIKADPEMVGIGLAKNLFQKRFIIAHNTSQAIQTRLMYLSPLRIGRLMHKMTRHAGK